MGRLGRLLSPRSLAVVGGRPAELALEQCRRLGFDGDLWPVHPTRALLDGIPCLPTVDDLPGVPDAALVAVNRYATVDVVGRLAAMGAGAAVCYASGFAEAGDDGRALQQDLLAAADGMPVVGPNCYGTVSATVGAALWPDQQGLSRVERGVALVTQSGNIGLNLTLQTRPLSISHLLTLGNQADVGIEECLEDLVGDPAVSAVGLHVEALHDVARFEEACRRASAAGVPVVALKTGSSPRAAEIAVSHTSSLVGADAAYGALFDRLGVRRVRSLAELLDTLLVLDRIGGLPGNRIVSLSCSGGEASIVADRCAGLDLNLPPFADAQAERIRTALGGGEATDLVSVSNPFDYHTFIWGDRDRLTDTFTSALDGPVDAALLILDFPGAGLDDATWWPTLEAFAEASASTGTPGVVAASLAENLPVVVEEAATDAGLVAVRGIEAALVVLEAAAQWGARPDHPPLLPPGRPPGPTRRTMGDEARKLLEEAGVPVPRWEVVSVDGAGEAADRLGYPVVVKAAGLAHKTEADAVALDLSDAGAVGEVARRIAEASAAETVIVERQVGDAVVELLVSVRREDPVGWLLTVGAGGTLVEVLEDTRSLLLPVTGEDVRSALQGLSVWPLLAGYRGRPGADVEAVVDAVLGVVRMVVAGDGLVEVECNPLIAGAEGATVVDVLVEREDPEGQR